MPKENLYKLGEKLGLDKNDIDDILKDRTVSDEHTSLSELDSYKHGTLYGTVSINKFKTQFLN